LSDPGAIAEPRLIGTWRLLSYALRNASGAETFPMGPRPDGQLMYDRAGNMSAHLMNPDPPARPADASDGAAYEALISYHRYASYFGRYSVDRDAATVSHALAGALMPGWAGTTVVRSYRFDGDDRLTLSAATGGAEQEQAILVWERLA
jgi:hypothetical protein